MTREQKGKRQEKKQFDCVVGLTKLFPFVHAEYEYKWNENVRESGKTWLQQNDNLLQLVTFADVLAKYTIDSLPVIIHITL